MTPSLASSAHDGERACARSSGGGEGQGARTDCPAAAGGGAAHHRGERRGSPAACSSEAQSIVAAGRQGKERWRDGARARSAQRVNEA
eukprot:1794376-Prymnesium_polylepis.1